MKEINENAFHQCVKSATRGKNILDLVLVYEKIFVKHLEQLTPLGKGDHNTLLIKLSELSLEEENFFIIYKYNKADYGELTNKIQKVDWENELEHNSVEKTWIRLLQILDNFKDNRISKFV